MPLSCCASLEQGSKAGPFNLDDACTCSEDSGCEEVDGVSQGLRLLRKLPGGSVGTN